MAPPSVGPAWRAIERVGEGSTAVVWRAVHTATGRPASLKVAKDKSQGAEAIAREAALLARVARRWGPGLLDAGVGFLATDWVEGSTLDPVRVPGDREATAARLAHAVGRALQELHEAGVRHGDVKPGNIVLAPALPLRDTAAERGATLIDLGLAGEMGAEARGGTPRYAAPELIERGQADPPADLWALGLVLAEVLDVTLATARNPRAALTSSDRGGAGPAQWAEALLAHAPGGRPDAAWVATRAARWLRLAADETEPAQARMDRVRRAYLNERAREIQTRAAVSAAITAPARGWLEEAIALREKTAPHPPAEHPVQPLAGLRRARWLIALVGPSAAAWPLGDELPGEGELAARAVELARIREPASWTLEDMMGRGHVAPSVWTSVDDADRIPRLVRELARPMPNAEALVMAEDHVATPPFSPTVALQLANALLRRGEAGRAWACVAAAEGLEVDTLRGEIARRRGDRLTAVACAERALQSPAVAIRSTAQATLARLAWDDGDLEGASRQVDTPEPAEGPAAAEIRALIAWRRGAFETGVAVVERALADPLTAETQARLEGTRGILELARGASDVALHAFGRAVELATSAGAVVDEATYLTSEAAAAADAGELARALRSATRSALLWERLGRPERAARAWLARAAALATMGAEHATDDAAEEATSRAHHAGDKQAAAYARWAQVEVRLPGDARARTWALEAAENLRGTGPEDEVRAAARLLIWAPDALDPHTLAASDEAAGRTTAAARWEWWGARAEAALAGVRTERRDAVLSALLALCDVPAPLGSRGPALDAAVRLAKDSGAGDAARRFEHARRAAAHKLHAETPAELRSGLASVAWARTGGAPNDDVEFAPGQVAQLEAIIRALSSRDRLRPLLEQVLDTLVIWTGVERGLLLLRAPDGRLVPRAARNLARQDLTGEQLALSHTIARRALETREAVVATDALSSLGDMHASIHALRLRSVLAVPLLARGEGLGVVYLDDRVRRDAFGTRELAWVRVVASQAAMAIADARDAVLLRRAARRAGRARAHLAAVLSQRETELDATLTQLQIARDPEGTRTRYPYDEIAGQNSQPMRDLLRLVDRVTASDVPVLVIGESGTGKELIARAVHKNGPRARRAFVSENCASVAETLLESALFGHVRGAFTGASSTRAGLFDVADGGTLFLDEIGEMSLGMQSKLLRVLQDGVVRAVGGERVRKVDVRVIGATHRDLALMVAVGTFREDLFYRLNVITLRVPPLRERAEDIPLLVEHILRKHAPGREVKLTRPAMAKLARFAWPGNVRQLENEVRRALVLGDSVIDVAELSPDVVRGGPLPARGNGLDMRTRVDALETELVVEALTKTGGNQTRAAQLLGLSRFGLQKMMKRLHVKAPAGD